MNIQILLIIFGSILVGIFIISFILLKKISELSKQKESDSLTLINQSMQGLQQEISRRLDKAAEVISGVMRELGKVQEIGRQIKDFQDFLRSPKLRGNISEQVLRDLLEQMLPKKHFELQYQFSEGQIVDAIVKTNQGIIPIDAKFPLENFKKAAAAVTEEGKKSFKKAFLTDVKRHISNIASKYILPQEGTVEFAIMYVPSEAIYYELAVNNPEIIDFGYEKKVYLVSPNSFYYFLKVVMIGLEGAKVAEASKKILKTLKAIEQDSKNFGQTLSVLSGHISNAKNAMDRVNNEYAKLASKIDNIKLLE